jgi:pimeloyl-ACP methyl ester carboxylesterase
MSGSTFASPFKTAAGEAEYMAAYRASLQLWPVPFEPIEINGRYGRTHLVAAGPEHAPALVLLHADFFSLTMWAANVADLSRERRVYAVDIMGQPGKSVPDPSQPLRTRDDAAEWITDLLDGLGLTRATLAGMSYGSWFTLNYAICARERLDSIVVLSPGGSFFTEGLGFNLRAYSSVLFPFLPQHLLFDRFTRAMIVEENLRDPVFFAINESLAIRCTWDSNISASGKTGDRSGLSRTCFPTRSCVVFTSRRCC